MTTRPYIVQAITTKYIWPSNTRGSRIKAKAAAGSVTVHYDDALNSEENHAIAAQALARKFKWRGHWLQGGMSDGCGYVFVSFGLERGAAPIAAFSTYGEED